MNELFKIAFADVQQPTVTVEEKRNKKKIFYGNF